LKVAIHFLETFRLTLIGRKSSEWRKAIWCVDICFPSFWRFSPDECQTKSFDKM